MDGPDGGWGWWVVAGAALINIFNQSLVSVFGLLLGPKIEAVSGPNGVADVMSISMCLLNLCGIAIGPLLQIMSTRTLSQIGVTMVAFGMLLSGYGQTYIAIVIGYGIFTGIGLGVISSSTFLIINSCFTKKKSLAVGIAMAGTSVGQVILPVTIGALQDRIGDDATILLMAGTSFFGIVGTFLFHRADRGAPPAEAAEKLVPDRDQLRGSLGAAPPHPIGCIECALPFIDDEDGVPPRGDHLASKKKTSYSNRESALWGGADMPPKCSAVSCEVGKRADDSIGQQDGRRRSAANEPPKRNASWYWREMMQGLDFRLLKRPLFLNTILGLSLVFTTNTSFSTFFPLFIEKEVQLSPLNTSSCLSVLSLTDFIGRITIPFLTSRFEIKARTSFIFGLLALSASRTLTVMQTDYLIIFICSACTGLVRSMVVVNQNVVVADSCQKANVSAGIGLFMAFKGVLIFAVGNAIGNLRSIYMASYAFIIHIMDGMSAAIAVSWILIDLYCWLFRSPSSAI